MTQFFHLLGITAGRWRIQLAKLDKKHFQFVSPALTYDFGQIFQLFGRIRRNFFRAGQQIHDRCDLIMIRQRFASILDVLCRS